MMMTPKISLLALAVAFLGSTATADEFNITFPCQEEGAALDACVKTNDCETKCGDMFASDTPTAAPGEDPLAGLDPSNVDAIKMSFQKSWDADCMDAKMQVCEIKKCCEECFDAVQASASCFTTEAIPLLEDTLKDLLSSAGDLLDGVLGAVNEVTGDVLNGTTLAPTTGAGSAAADGAFTGFFDGLKCDFDNNPCDGSPPPPDSPASTSDATPGSAPGPAPADGSAPSDSPSAAVVVGSVKVLSGVVAAVLGMLLL